MRKTASTHWWILAAACCCMLLCATPSSAAESDAINETPKIDNVGFMENPPKELVDRFPMCDAFLNVEWIDKEKKIGISHYSLYNEKGEKVVQSIDALIHLDPQFPRYDYSTTEYYPGSSIDSPKQPFNKKNLHNLRSLIKNGKVDRTNIDLRIKGNSRGIEFARLPYESYSLANHQRNICVPYPGNHRMWLAENKYISKIYSNDKLKKIRKTLESAHLMSNKISILEGFDCFLSVDLNFDGKQDYYACNSLLYSVGDDYYELIRGSHAEYGKLKFPPFCRKCEINAFSDCYLTTDGEQFFLNNQCNLTESTKGDE
ncbi:hypothetical protein [Oceanidesulfovibrio marinus]|uniref:hypothetical protein n=1 Tax=Oceanidesulfovibrio marinus TaxID=370038 RepID=UPI0011865E5C|nr:hypothetical protein [Oceanidesulfovibrio marinus]